MANRCSIALTAGPLDTAPVWTDAGRVISCKVRRGRRANEGRSEPGSCEVVIDDPLRRLDPTNPASPWASSLGPMRQVKVDQILDDASTVRLFTGYLDDVEASYDPPRTTVRAVDALAWLGTQRPLQRLYGPVVIADVPLGYWRMGEPLGATALRDHSGNGYHVGFKSAGTPTGAFTPAAVGALIADPDGAVDMGPTGTMLVGAGANPFSSAVWSIECWVRKQGAVAADLTIMTLAFGNPMAGYVHLRISPAGRIRVDRSLTPGGTTTSISHTTGVVDGQWHHVLVMHNTGNISVDVDGVRQAAALGTTTGWLSTFDWQIITGAYELDEVATYTRLLTIAERDEHWQLGRGRWGAPIAQRTGARVGLMLDAVGWPAAWRSIDAGVEDVMAPNVEQQKALATGSAAAHLGEVAAVEGGRLFVTRSGLVRFTARPLVTPAATITYTNAPVAGSLRFTAARPSRRRADVVNRAEVSRVGGVVQSAESASSVARFLRHDAPARTGLYGDDQDAAAAARRLVYEGKESVVRIDQLVVNARLGPAEEAGCAAREIGDVLSVRLNPPMATPQPSTHLCAVEGVSQQLDTGRRWSATYDLSLVRAPQVPGAAVIAVPDRALTNTYGPFLLPYEVYDTANMHAAQISDRLIIQVAGEYLLHGVMAVAAASGMSIIGIVTEAGVTLAAHSSALQTGGDAIVSATTTRKLAVGDTLRLYAAQHDGTGTARSVLPYWPRLTAVLL